MQSSWKYHTEIHKKLVYRVFAKNCQFQITWHNFCIYNHIQTNEVDQRLHPIIIMRWGFNQYPSKIFASWHCLWMWHINSLVHVIQTSWCFLVIHDREAIQTTYIRMNFTGNAMLQTLYISYFTEVLYSARITVLHQKGILRSMILCTFLTQKLMNLNQKSQVLYCSLKNVSTSDWH